MLEKTVSTFSQSPFKELDGNQGKSRGFWPPLFYVRHFLPRHSNVNPFANQFGAVTTSQRLNRGNSD